MNNNLEKVQVAWIAGMPRSGTTWLSQIFASSPEVRLKTCPLFSYDFKNALNESSSAEEWDKLFSEVYQTNSEFLDQGHLRKHGLVPLFEEKHENPSHLIIKSVRFHNLVPHILEVNTNIRFIHIVRHPCATIHSWITDPKQFPADADPMMEWKTGKCRKTGPGEFWGFDDWKTVTTQALRLNERYPDRFRILRYEHLVQDTQKCIKELFDYLDIAYEKQTKDFILLSQSRHDDHKHSVFKDPKLIGKWREQLEPSIISQCMLEIKDTELEQFAVN